MFKGARWLAVISLITTATAFVSPLRSHGSFVSRRRSWVSAPLASDSSGAAEGASAEEIEDAGTLSLDDSRLYQVELPAATGIQWGSDLQLRSDFPQVSSGLSSIFLFSSICCSLLSPYNLSCR